MSSNQQGGLERALEATEERYDVLQYLLAFADKCDDAKQPAAAEAIREAHRVIWEGEHRAELVFRSPDDETRRPVWIGSRGTITTRVNFYDHPDETFIAGEAKVCEACAGTGAALMAHSEECSVCDGSGWEIV